MASSPFTATLLSNALPHSARAPAQASSGAVEAAMLSRQRIGPAKDHLYDELMQMYWIGVKRELEHILLSLTRWQQDDFKDLILPDEEDSLIHGYDTFLAQVNHNSRKYANVYDSRIEKRDKKRDKDKPPSYDESLQHRGWDFHAEKESGIVKQQVRAILDQRPDVDVLRRRARMLLQAGAFLDIDKAIEYREPEPILSFWRRPAVPQLKIDKFEHMSLPSFVPLQCTECHNIIRGSFFKRTNMPGDFEVCEGCYRKRHYGDSNFTKVIKHCILDQSITSRMSRMLCRCCHITRIDPDGRAKALFPIQADDKHRKHPFNENAPQCMLLGIAGQVTQAKYDAVLSKLESHITLADLQRADFEKRDRMRRAHKKQRQRERKKAEKEAAKNKGNQIPVKVQTSRTDPDTRVAEFGTSAVLTKRNYEKIPVFVRPVTSKYPFGNVHMALRVGPIMIENGVNDVAGVLITYRDPQNLQVLRDSGKDIEHGLQITGAENRKLYRLERSREPKRYKAILKQVAGGAFSGLFSQTLEERLLDLLIRKSQETPDDGLGAAEKAMVLDKALEEILSVLKPYLSSRIEIYIQSIVDRLLDAKIELKWNFQTNNCQTFCDSLINLDLFGALLAPVEEDRKPAAAPLYLMSFVCRPGAYVVENIKSKYDVPNGLMEEYLLKFRYGRHDESDVIDTCLEYWHDWGAFGGPIYPYQDVFPWDCTEAYRRYPVKCNHCNISKHVWAFPFDSWSMVSLHLSRSRNLYALSTDKNKGKPDLTWMRNRLTVLLAQDVLLTGAAAMAKSSKFRESTLWLHNQEDPKLDRLKLGGIHRAQPFSHHFEKGELNTYFLAEWADKSREERTQKYELLRDGRQRQRDVKKENENDINDSSGCDGCGGGFGCGGVTAGCAGGCSRGCDGGCGAGCEGGCASYASCDGGAGCASCSMD